MIKTQYSAKMNPNTKENLIHEIMGEEDRLFNAFRTDNKTVLFSKDEKKIRSQFLPISSEVILVDDDGNEAVIDCNGNLVDCVKCKCGRVLHGSDTENKIKSIFKDNYFCCLSTLSLYRANSLEICPICDEINGEIELMGPCHTCYKFEMAGPLYRD